MLLAAFVIAAGLDTWQPSQPVPAQDVTAAAAQAQPSQAEQPGEAEQPPAKEEPSEPPTPPHTGIHALFRNLGGDFKQLPAKDNAYLALLGGGLARRTSRRRHVQRALAES